MLKLKNTKQREAILKILNLSEAPLSAEAVHEKIKYDFPNVAVSTIYRNLEKFEENGIVRREIFNDGVLRFTPVGQHEHFLICTCCSEKIPLPECPVSEMEKMLMEETGYTISGHSLSIYGKCPKCQNST